MGGDQGGEVQSAQDVLADGRQLHVFAMREVSANVLAAGVSRAFAEQNGVWVV